MGRWTGSWRSGAISGRFTLQIARGGGDRLTATAVWSGLPTVRREFTGALANGQLILGDPKTDGLALTAQRRGVGGFSLGGDPGRWQSSIWSGPTRCSSTAGRSRAPPTCRKAD